MCNSLEPGFYEVGSFGIRLETLVAVVKANTKVMSLLFSNASSLNRLMHYVTRWKVL